jgi:hypothetical protein
LEILSVSKGLLDLSLQTGLVLDSFAAIGYEFLREFFDLICFLFELLDDLALDFDHLFEVVALQDKIGDGLFVVGLVPAADFYEHIEALMFEQREGVLILDFLDFVFDLSDLLFLLFHFLFVLQLVLIVVLYDFQLFESFREYLVFVQIGVHLSADGFVVLLQFLQFLHHLSVRVLFYSWEKAGLCAVQLANRIAVSLILFKGVQEVGIICCVFGCDKD